MSKYNINELLEKKKELEEQILEKTKGLTTKDMEFRKEVIIDHTHEDRESKYTPKPKQSLNEFCQVVFGLIDELEKVKIAIQKYNADKVLGDIQKRESARIKYSYLSQMKKLLPSDKSHSRKVTRQDKEGVALETTDITTEPFFDTEEIEKQMNQFAAQERKINTTIQKKNLEAEIEL